MNYTDSFYLSSYIHLTTNQVKRNVSKILFTLCPILNTLLDEESSVFSMQLEFYVVLVNDFFILFD